MVTLTGKQAAEETAAQMAASYGADYLAHAMPSIRINGVAITPPKDYRDRHAIWRTIRDAYAGEITVKRNGEKYLRRPANVKPADYATYKNRAYWYNGTRRTHSGLLGAVMRKPIELTLPTGLKIDLANVTKDGLSFQQFGRKLISELILVSRYGVLVDIPEKTPAGDVPQPYFSGYNAEDILFPRTTIINGRVVLDRLVLLESERVENDYGYDEKPIYRVLRLDPDPDAKGQYVYSQQVIRPGLSDENSDQITNLDVRPQGRKIRYIPFVFFNPTDLLPTCSDPMLMDIVMLNLAHYEATALLQHGRFYAGMPTYYIAGDSQNNDPLSQLAEGLGSTDPMTVGPSNLWLLGTGEKAGILEFNGHGLSFLENAVDSIQLQMQSLGGKLIPTQRKAAALSAEAYGLMEAGDEVTLLDIVNQADAGCKILFDYANDLQNNAPADNGLCEFNKEFIRSELTAREVRAIQTLYERRLIPLDVLYYTLRQVGVIPQEYSLEDFKVLLGQKDQLYTDPSIEPVPGGPRYNPADITDPRNKPVLPKNDGSDPAE